MATATALGLTSLVTCTDANVLYEVTFPLNARAYLLQFRTNAGLLLETGGTDLAAVGVNVPQRVVADWSQERQVPGARGRTRNLNANTRKVWVGSTIAGTVCEITPHVSPTQ